jgi:hypothetical protein
MDSTPDWGIVAPLQCSITARGTAGIGKSDETPDAQDPVWVMPVALQKDFRQGARYAFFLSADATKSLV